MLAVGATTLLDLGQRATLYYFVLVVLIATYAFIAMLLRSRFGHALAGIRVNEQRMRAAGFATMPYKLAAFVVAGALAGLAGFLLAVKDGAVNPELLSWHESGAVLLMLIFGGIGTCAARDRRGRVHAAERFRRGRSAVARMAATLGLRSCFVARAARADRLAKR